MEKVLLMILAIALVFQISGCAKRLSKKEEAEYHRMEKAYEEMMEGIDTDKYEEAILFLVSDDISSKEGIEAGRSKFKDLIDDRVFESLIAGLPDENINQEEEDLTNWEDDPAEWQDDEIIEEDDFDDILEGLEIPENVDIENIKNILRPNEEGLYPIYGDYFEIIGYGTKEEAVKALIDFYSKPLNTIRYIGSYKSIVMARIDNKYSGEFLVRVKVKNGKIIDYEIYK